MAIDMQDILAKIQALPEDAKNAVMDAVTKVKSAGDLGDVLREHGIDLDPSQLQDVFDNLKENAGTFFANAKDKAADVLDADKDGNVDLDDAKKALDSDGNGKVDLVEKAKDALDNAKDALDKDHDGKVDMLDKAKDALDKDHDGKIDLIDKAKDALDKDHDGKVDLIDKAKDAIGGIFHKKDDAQ